MAKFQGIPIEFNLVTDADIARVCASVPVRFWKGLGLHSQPVALSTNARYVTVGCPDGWASADFDRAELPFDDTELLATIVRGLAQECDGR